MAAHASIGSVFVLAAAQHAFGDSRLTRPPADVVDAEIIAAWLNPPGTAAPDVRVLVLGDSFALSNWKTTPSAFPLVWPHRLAAASGGAAPPGAIVRGTIDAVPAVRVEAASVSNYSVLTSTPGSEYFALPMRGMVEVYGHAGLTLGPDARMVRLRVEDSVLAQSPAGAMIRPGDGVLARVLFWCPPDPMVMADRMDIARGTSVVQSIQTRTAARPSVMSGGGPGPVPPTPDQVNAAPTDLVWQHTGGSITLDVRSGTLGPGTFNYLHPAGSVFSRADLVSGQRHPGPYLSILSDTSWSYFGFGEDRPPTFQNDKVFTTAQLAHWLDATTLDPAQPVVAIYSIAAERPLPGDDKAAQIEAMIDKTNAAAAMAGLPSPRHLLIVPHAHWFWAGGVAFEPEVIEAQRDMMFEIAARRADTAAVSLYDATGGVVFDGSPASRAWLTANAPSPFRYGSFTADLAGAKNGNLLDIYKVHPLDQDAGAYFASVVWDLINTPGRPVDLNSDSVIDINDLYAWYASPADLDQDGDADADDAAGLERYLRRDEAEDMLAPQR